MRHYALISVSLISCLSILACTDSGSSNDLPRVLLPCDNPAPFEGIALPPSLGYIVALQSGADQVAEAARIASACELGVYEASSTGDWFTATLDVVEIGCVRCDPVVVMVAPNAVVYPLFKVKAGS